MELSKYKSPYYNRGGQHTAARIFAHIFGERHFFQAVFTSVKPEVLNVQYFLV